MAGDVDDVAVRASWRPVVSTIICVLGTGLAGWLTWGHYFDQHAITNTCDAFSKGGVINCGLVTTSAQSIILGVPVALWGLLYFVGMLVLCIPKAWSHPSQRLAQLRLAGVVAGMAFVLYLVGVEFLSLKHICIYCTGEHILEFCLFLVVITGWEDTGYAQLVYEYDDVEEFDETAQVRQ